MIHITCARYQFSILGNYGTSKRYEDLYDHEMNYVLFRTISTRLVLREILQRSSLQSLTTVIFMKLIVREPYTLYLYVWCYRVRVKILACVTNYLRFSSDHENRKNREYLYVVNIWPGQCTGKY